MTLKFNRVRAVVEVHITELSAAVHELSCVQRKKLRRKTIQSVATARTVEPSDATIYRRVKYALDDKVRSSASESR